jgi:hypothetical protein
MKTTTKIANLKRKPESGFVFEVAYIMNFELENEIDRKLGMIEFEINETESNFIPYEELTEEIVLGWVIETLGEEEITKIETEYKTKLEERIEEKSHPEFLIGAPWEAK